MDYMFATSSPNGQRPRFERSSGRYFLPLKLPRTVSFLRAFLQYFFKQTIEPRDGQKKVKHLGTF